MPSMGLSKEVLESINGILTRYPAVTRASIFGSRAKGTHKSYSDVDICLYGEPNLWATERIRSDLDELPLPFSFDVLDYDSVNSAELQAHIDRVGIVIYQGGL